MAGFRSVYVCVCESESKSDLPPCPPRLYFQVLSQLCHLMLVTHFI